MSQGGFSNSYNAEDLTPEKRRQINRQIEKQLRTAKSLVDREKSLIAILHKKSATNANKADLDLIVNDINAISNARESLQKSLLSLTTVLQSQVAETRGDLVDEMTVVGVMETELNNAKKNMNSLIDAKNNKLRMVEINTYYGKRYEEHTKFMKLIIIICIPLLLLAILGKKDIIGQDLAKTLSGIIIAIGIILIVIKIYDLSRRDNMNYDEYNFIDWGNPATKDEQTVWEYDKEQLFGVTDAVESDFSQALSMSDNLGCIGSECCGDDTSWDNGECMASSANDFSESFASF
jgi:hypothetical protein